MEPPPPASGTPCSGGPAAAVPAAAPAPAPDLVSTREPGAKQVSRSADTQPSSGTPTSGGSRDPKPSSNSAPPPPGSSHKKKRKKSSSAAPGRGKARGGKRRNFHLVPSPADCRWTSNAEQFEEARASQPPHSTPTPAPAPALVPPPPVLVSVATSRRRESPSVGPAATCLAMAAGGAGATAGRAKIRRPWEWSREDCAAVARDAISSCSGAAGAGFAGAGAGACAGTGGVSLLVGAGGAVLFSDSDGADEDAISDDDGGRLEEEEEEEEQEKEEGGEEGEPDSTSTRKRDKSGTRPSSGVVDGAARRIRARPSHPRKATRERPETRSDASGSIAAATVVSAVVATPTPHGDESAENGGKYHKDDGEPLSSRTGRRRAAPGRGQEREPGRPTSSGVAVPPPRPGPGVPSADKPTGAAVEVVAGEDERKARELSAKLNRNRPRRVLPHVVEPGAIKPGAERPRSATPSSGNKRVAAGTMGRPPAAKRSNGSNGDGGETRPSSRQNVDKKEKEKENKNKNKNKNPPKKTAAGAAARESATAVGEGGGEDGGAGAGDPWTESGLFFGVGTTAEVSLQTCRVATVSCFFCCMVYVLCVASNALRNRGIAEVSTHSYGIVSGMCSQQDIFYRILLNATTLCYFRRGWNCF